MSEKTIETVKKSSNLIILIASMIILLGVLFPISNLVGGLLLICSGILFFSKFRKVLTMEIPMESSLTYLNYVYNLPSELAVNV